MRPDSERSFAEVLADIVGVEEVSVDSHFFDDLGADSMLMAQFCARVRKRDDLPSVSMRDVYRNPTISGLTAALAAPAPAAVEAPGPASRVAPAGEQSPTEAPRRAGTPQYILCGVLQLLCFLGYSYLIAVGAALGYDWVSLGSGLLDFYLRVVAMCAGVLVVLCTLPIAAKWLLIGRWRPRQFRAWSLTYVRFWVVKTLVQRNVMVLFFLGSPLYSLYLRALGAKIGRGVAIFSQHVPVCTDLLRIGDGAVIRKDAFFACYRTHAGLVQAGSVTVGKDAFVGEMTVLDIGTSLGDGAQLGHTSSLHTGQAVPDGECWHGSPAQRAGVDYRAVEPRDCGTLRRFVYSVQQVLLVVLVYLPLLVGGTSILLITAPQLTALLGSTVPNFAHWTFYWHLLVTSAVLFVGIRLAGFLVMTTVPRVLSLAIKPDKVYRLYSFQYSVHRAIRLTTNLKFFKSLFGDSSAIAHYLRSLGYRLSPIEQTGSNFGMVMKHESPFLTTIGTGTMVADGLSVMNAEYSSSSFRVSRTSVGPRNFLGNFIAYPSGGRTGENCLLATKVMVPIDGPVREGVGLLGSPSFEIPRSVARDTDVLRTGDELRRGLRGKNRHNAVTMMLYALAQWIYFYVLLMVARATEINYSVSHAPIIALASVATLTFSIVYFVLIERVVTLILPVRPLYCSIYDRRFWRHERFWKLSATTLVILDGTPFKNLAWRLLGVRLGKRVFDDGCVLSEKTILTIGDDVTLNAGSHIQCHSQEDGAFKSDRIVIGAGSTVGVNALVHYGTQLGAGAVLEPGSFLMKGEEVPERATWGGNPARETRVDQHEDHGLINRRAQPAVGHRPPAAPSRRSRRPRWLRRGRHTVSVSGE